MGIPKGRFRTGTRISRGLHEVQSEFGAKHNFMGLTLSSPLRVVPGITRHDVPLSIMAGRYASFLSVEVNSSRSTVPYLQQTSTTLTSISSNRDGWDEGWGEVGGKVLETKRNSDIVAGGDRGRDEHVTENAAIQR